MATVAASVAAGHTVTPVLVRPAGSSSDAATTGAQPTTSAQPLTQAEADALRDLMRGVVTEGGATFLQDVPAPEVYAKTGTAQYETGSGLANHAWMIAIHGDLAVCVFVDTGDYGSTTAGPLMEQFLRNVAAQ
jgi:cell division protein FtsI/penicillin-binding protein 2